MKNLKLALRLNAASCLVFGLLFVVMPAATGNFLGVSSAVAITIVGAALLLNGAHLLVASLKQRVNPFEVYYFSVGDLLWVNVTLMLVASESFLPTPASKVAALLVAAFVGAVGVFQLAALSKLSKTPNSANAADHLPDHLPVAKAIAASWVSMKLWVKYWLFALNAVFLAAVFILPEPLARYTLMAYAASGPWLLAIMLYQRGLTRLLGLAHLVPWLPLLVYLAARLTSNNAGTQITFAATPVLWAYAVGLMCVVGCCLVVDAVDVWRWLRGERYRLGSVRAQAAGASSLWLLSQKSA
jgi:hypothetical protein